jgi:nucleoside-diphosphate-sugar epimerase
VMADKPAHRVYNSGGMPISLGEIAAIVRSYLPDASITFENETGARAGNPTYLLDNSRLVSEFAIRYPPLRDRILQMINDVRRENALSPVG